MSPETIQKTTAQRLTAYNLFSKTTINTVATFAGKQSEYKTYQEFLKDIGIPEVSLHVTQEGVGVPVVDVPARTKKQKGVLVMHLPMGNSLDPNQLYQIATIAAVNPEYRVIGFGNPSGKPFSYPQQNLTFRKRINIAFAKNTRPLIAAELDYLAKQGISQTYQLGYSYGALKALILSEYSSPSSIEGLILVEPVAHPRYPQQLLKDFTSSFKPLGKYVDRTEIPTYFAAREDAVKLVDYSKGLSRQINIAIGWMLSRVDFINTFETVLKSHPNSTATVAWGSKSEVGNDALMTSKMHTYTHKNPKIRAMRLEDDVHAFANDIHLHAAIVREALQ
ncbi:MAG: hypothetical protein WAQ27_05650 [Candidatus Microsaccharimonas sp.]